MTQTKEALGPAEQTIQALIAHSDHLVHNRPGIVSTDLRSVTGVKWEPVTHKEVDGTKTVFRLVREGKKTTRVPAGALRPDNSVYDGDKLVGRYQPAGIFQEVAAWMYQKVASVWSLDNEFAARWASYAFDQTHEDMKTVLAAFMLCQSRKGDPVIDEGKVAFYDEDYREVGEAMCLLYSKVQKGLNPKLLLRIRDLLSVPAVCQINRDLGFALSQRNPYYGRWPQAVTAWLEHRENNPKLLESAVRSGWRMTIMSLAVKVGYKPTTPAFFQTLRWKQKQADDGRRTIAIGEAVSAAQSWVGLSEEQICQKIVTEKPNWKLIASCVPVEVGITRSIVVAALEVKALSDKDLIIMTPTLEELGLLEVKGVKSKWEKALAKAEDTRAAHIATRVRSKDAQEKLQTAADTVVKKAVAEVVRGIRVYFFVDVSGSMTESIATAKKYIAQFLHGFPMEQIHICAFTTVGRTVEIKHASAAGVENAFKGIASGGGTSHSAAVMHFSNVKPKPDEDVLFFFVGDEEDQQFAHAVRVSGLNPVAFAFLKVKQNYSDAVRGTAALLNIPCFMVSESTFADAYAIPRTLRNLIASTPTTKLGEVLEPKRVGLVDQIQQTKLLQKPAWAT